MKKTELTINEKEAIEDLLDQFDFSKAHALFTLMGWTYWDSPIVPTIERLKLTAKQLLIDAIKSDSHEMMSGRFRATHFEGDGELHLEIVFYEKSVYIK